MRLTIRSAALALALMPCSGMATPISIDLTTGPSDASATRTITDIINGMDVMIASVGRDGNLTFGPQGLGIVGGGGANANARINADEIVRFDFGRAVRDLRVRVGALTNDDAARSYTLISPSGVTETILPAEFVHGDAPDGHGGIYWNAVSMSDGAPIATLLVETTATSSNGGFSVRSVHYDAVEPAPVPVPAASLLLSGAVAAFAWLGRRRRSSNWF
jgi:hypothetical protein